MKEKKKGWVRYVGTFSEGKVVLPGEVYPCLITEEGFIQLPEKFGDFPFRPGVSFEIVDPFLLHISEVLK